MSIVKEKKLWWSRWTWHSSFGWLALSLMLVIDQVSKWWFQMRDLIIFNKGGVLGIFPSLWWGIFLAILWAIVVRYWIDKPWDGPHWGMGMIIVGGLGNIMDRMLFGGQVRDFIYYPIFGFYGNIADIFLVVGVTIIIIYQIIEGEKQLEEEKM